MVHGRLVGRGPGWGHREARVIVAFLALVAASAAVLAPHPASGGRATATVGVVDGMDDTLRLNQVQAIGAQQPSPPTS